MIVGADTPSSIALSMKTFARSGVAFAIMTSKVQLTKNVVGRVRTTDSFDVSVTSPEATALATATTGSADTATTGELTVLPLSSGASYTLSEALTPASGTRQSDYLRAWSCTNNGVAEPSLPSGSGPSVSVAPEAGDFIACTVTNTQLPADLSVDKTVSAESAAAGDPITYTIEAENQGPSGADAVLLEDVLPAGVDYVSDNAGCDVGALPTVQCDLGTLLDGESRTVQIVAEVQPAAAGSLQTNSAKVSALQPDDEPANDESSASTAVEPFADLAITKAVSPKLVSAFGENITYTLAVENRGESQSSSTTVTDTLPAGLGYVSDDAGCDTAALPTITCDLGALDKGESKTIQVVAEVEGSAAGKAIDNTAAVSGSSFDPDPANNEASAALEVEPLSDLAITKTTPASSTKPGESITYQLTAENKGPTTDLVTVTDTLPPALAYVSDDASCDTAALPTISCDLGALDKGESKTIQIVAEVAATSGTIENTAEVSGGNPDPELANNSSTAKTTIEPISDLAIVKTASLPTVQPGETLTYTLEVENAGTSASPLTTVTDTLPAGLTYVSDDAGCAVAAQREISCALGALGSGSTKTIHVLVAVAASATGTIENTAVVSGTNFDPDPSNDESTAATAVEEIADLATTKTTLAATAKPGETITYTLNAENQGPSTSSPTVVTDTLPPGLGYVSDDAGCDTTALPAVSCDLGSLANGEAKTVHVVVEVTATTGSVENTAGIDGPLPDPDPSDDEASATVAVEAVSDLAIEKTASAPTVKPGQQLTYTLEVENKGPSASDPTTVTDALPAQLAYVSDDASCDTSALPQVECNLGSMVAGATATIEIVTEVAAATGTIENTAEVAGPNPDPTPGDNEATESTTIAPLASDLALTKSAPGSAVKAGDQITYTLVASNHGPDPSPQTLLADTLPANLSYVSDDAGCDIAALPQIECDLGTVADGESRTIHIVTAVTATADQPIRNDAQVSGANPDPDPGNNPDAAQTPVTPIAAPPTSPAPPSQPPKKPKKGKRAPRLVLTKHAGSAIARPGSVISYRITVANEGDGPARKVVVCDHPPAAQHTLRTEPRASGKAEPCWKLAQLAAGDERTFRLTAMVDPDSGQGAQRNRATVEAANAKGVRADTAGVWVKPLPNTGCLARPSGAGLLPEIEFLC